MFYTQNYRHGWIHESHYPGTPATYRAQAPCYRDLGEFKSLRAAKLAITRDAVNVRAQRARDAAEHHAFVQNVILGGAK